MNPNVKKVVEIATSFAGKNIHGMPGCPDDTCAFFVRYVFRSALHKAGEMPVASDRPYYKEHHIRALPTGENFADSLAGEAIGLKVPFGQMQPGDILLFKDTCRGNWDVGSITHVGICVGPNGLMADSSRGKCHVRSHSNTFPGLLVEVRRPRCLGGAGGAVGGPVTGITLSNGQAQAVDRGNKTSHQEISIRYGGPTSYMIGGHMSSSSRANLEVLVNGKSALPFKYLTVDIGTGGNSHVKLFHHDGKTRAYIGSQETSSLSVTAKFQGAALHVWVNNKEVKPTSVNIGIS